jgi:hypothetical protein
LNILLSLVAVAVVQTRAVVVVLAGIVLIHFLYLLEQH